VLGGLHLGDGLVPRGVERLADGLEGLDVEALERGVELLHHHAHAVDDRVRRLGRGERPLEVVDAGQDLLEDVLARLEPRVVLLLARALAEVVEVGGGAEEPLVVVGLLLLDGGEALLEPGELRGLGRRLVRLVRRRDLDRDLPAVLVLRVIHAVILITGGTRDHPRRWPSTPETSSAVKSTRGITLE
jgi:hypothetical protein